MSLVEVHLIVSPLPYGASRARDTIRPDYIPTIKTKATPRLAVREVADGTVGRANACPYNEKYYINRYELNIE